VSKKPHFQDKPHQVWQLPDHPGYRRSMESAGTVAAPLLAGFSFTLLVLLLPTLGDKTTTVRVGAQARVATGSQDFSRAPELAAILLLLAGLLLVAAVQAAVTMRYHSHTPGELAELYPEYFPLGDDPDVEGLPGWWTEHAAPARVGNRWYGGWAREYLYDELVRADRWAGWARRAYHAGIVALLAGLAMLVLPPDGVGDPARWVLFGIAIAGVVGEAIWIAALSFG
jgi:hypothetical protein